MADNLDNLFHFFGAGAGGGQAFTFEPPPPPPQSAPAPLAQEQRGGVETARLESRLEAALEQIRHLGGQLDTANKAERIARDAFTSLRSAWIASPDNTKMSQWKVSDLAQAKSEIDNLNDKIKYLEDRRTEDAQEIEDREGKLADKEKEIEGLKKDLKERDTQIKTKESEHEKNIAAHVKSYKHLEKEFTQAQASASEQEQLAAKHLEAVEWHKVRAENEENTKKHTLAAIEHERKQFEVTRKAKEDIEKQHEVLREENENIKARLEETYTFSEDLDALNTAQQNLQADFDRQTEIQRDLERTIIVKDERIAQLESQYQKERQRVLDAQDAQSEATVAAVNSPIHEAPPFFSDVGNSLQDLLEGQYDEGGPEDFLQDEHTISDITAVSSPPVEPVRPTSTVQVSESANVSPIRPVRPAFDIQVSEIANFSPIEPVRPTSTVQVSESANVSPIEPAAPELASYVNAGTSVEPVEPFEVIEAPRPVHDFSKLSVASTTPKEPKQNLTRSMLPDLSLDSPPIAPAQPEAPKLTYEVVESGSIAPIPPTTKHNMSPTTTIHIVNPYPTPSPTDMPSVDDEASTPSNPQAPTNSDDVPTTETAAEHTDEQDIEDKIIERQLELERQLDSFVQAMAQKEPTPNRLSKLLIFLVPIILCLATYCYRLYSEVDDWRAANGFAFRGSHSRGAYGNGRYLFGRIPLAMDVDDFGFAALLSKLIRNFEKPVAYY